MIFVNKWRFRRTATGERMKTLGIIGGMGPQATLDLYEKIVRHTPAHCDQEHLHVIIDSYPQIPDRTACICGQGEDPLPFLEASAQRLQQAGAEALLMPCNTAHYFVPELRRRISLPFLHIAEATLASMDPAQHGKRIGVLETRGTRAAGIYRHALEAAGYQAVEPDEVQAAQLMRCIYEGAKAGKTAEYAPFLNDTVSAMAADSFILACTEIPLFLPYWKDPRPVVDATDALARAAVAFALAP